MKLTRRRIFGFAWMPVIFGWRNAGAQPFKTPDERATLYEMIYGLRWTQMLAVVAKLGIADLLSDGPRSVKELAGATRTHEDSLYRVLRTLAGRGVFFEEDGRRFRLTPAAALLRSGVPGSLRVTAHVMGDDWYWNSWGALNHTVATGQTGFDHVYGKNTWDWFTEHPEPAALFNAFQTEGTMASARAVLEAFDFSPYRVIADIGGGEGEMVAGILARNGASRGILLDLPHVVASAEKTLPPAIRKRTQLVPGDFFASVPAGADLYVLKHIVHDWNDQDAHRILVSCRRAMSNASALLLIDHVICGPNQLCESKVGDVAMMVRTGGRNRTEAEFRDLLKGAGFDLRSMKFTSAGLGILQAVPRAL